jgi:hypothetical protein
MVVGGFIQSINLLLYEFFQISTRITDEWNLKKMHNGRQTRWITDHA